MIQNYDCDVEKIADDLLKAISEQQWWPYDVFVYTGDSEEDVKQKALDSLKEVTPKLYVCYLEKLSKQLLDKIADSEWWPYSLAIYESESADNLAKNALDSFKMYTDKQRPPANPRHVAYALSYMMRRGSADGRCSVRQGIF
ncbi:hypothetical protein Y032_0352g3276 [Ancylostoma ceylanicum]|uniref:Uncharacterized protein n=1 Tax=Ancylostoma ceylanicum TaxID=53326 RepID=A0A016RXN1_9BILA|nr:hypothetical protein Y032_0352g3276 [Ancylostoma ceylanicum]